MLLSSVKMIYQYIVTCLYSTHQIQSTHPYQLILPLNLWIKVLPIPLSPVDVGLPSGASAVYCFNSFGNVFTSLFAIAIDGLSTKIDVMDVADMILLHIQFLRDESLLIGGIFVDDSALQ